jgi:hypothetical protein
MNEEQRVAFLLAQIASMYAELEAKKALNVERQSLGFSLAYGEEAFAELPEKYGLTHNQVISFLLDYHSMESF